MIDYGDLSKSSWAFLLLAISIEARLSRASEQRKVLGAIAAIRTEEEARLYIEIVRNCVGEMRPFRRRWRRSPSDIFLEKVGLKGASTRPRARS
jgi:hypothetical protein